MAVLQKHLGVALFGLLVGGCASLPSVTSGQIGCAESDITISNDESGWGTRTWTAMCHGKTFYCSAHGGGNGSASQVSCKGADEQAAPPARPAVAASPTSAAPPPAAAEGCKFDTQCKGDRICRAGSCADK